jgi:hypothetical protein
MADASAVKLTAAVPMTEATYETYLVVATVDYAEGEKSATRCRSLS